jgi:hypothetical protein
MTAPRNFHELGAFKEVSDKIKDDMQELDLQDPNKSDIKSSSLTGLLSVQAHSQEVSLHELIKVVQDLVPEGDTREAVRQNLKGIAEKHSLATKVVQKKLHNGRSKQLGQIDLEKSTIQVLPTFTVGDAGPLKTEVPDSALKLLPDFSGEGNNTAEDLERFLKAIFDVTKTNRLAEKTVCAVIMRKSTKTARILLENLMESSADPPLLKHVVLFLEEAFSSDWQPPLARAKLARLTKSSNMSYHTLLSQTLRLTYLASLDQPQGSRAVYREREGMSAYLKALATQDRSLVLKADEDRAGAELPPLSVAQMAQYLLNYHSQRKAHEATATANTAPSNNTSMICAPSTEHAKYAQQTFPGRGRGSYGASQGRGYRGGQGYQNARPRGQTQTPQYRQPQARQPQYKESWRGQGARNRAPNPQAATQPFVTYQAAGVERNQCIRCGSSRHLMKSDQCLYAGKNLAPAKCFNCQTGAHFAKECQQGRATVSRSQDRPRGRSSYGSRGNGRARSSSARGSRGAQRSQGDRPSAQRGRQGDRPQRPRQQSQYDKIMRMIQEDEGQE